MVPAEAVSPLYSSSSIPPSPSPSPPPPTTTSFPIPSMQLSFLILPPPSLQPQSQAHPSASFIEVYSKYQRASAFPWLFHSSVPRWILFPKSVFPWSA